MNLKKFMKIHTRVSRMYSRNSDRTALRTNLRLVWPKINLISPHSTHLRTQERDLLERETICRERSSEEKYIA